MFGKHSASFLSGTSFPASGPVRPPGPSPQPSPGSLYLRLAEGAQGQALCPEATPSHPATWRSKGTS